ncbi:MAG: hypothetical protein VB096_10325 [Pseudoflavonifractor sp.]|nr:hypothetical protein [Pseudoflavonifractor sp.]
MSYYRTCPACGANLDPGETCDCIKDAAPGATNTQDGKAEQISSKPNYSTPILGADEGDCQG